MTIIIATRELDKINTLSNKIYTTYSDLDEFFDYCHHIYKDDKLRSKWLKAKQESNRSLILDLVDRYRFYWAEHRDTVKTFIW
ncbi:MAG: hypothetical protein R3321_02405 [Nitrososphaeraceae archaeon]|nr:hypothetical protein [Nitrososphaeraceae archaeon]